MNKPVPKKKRRQWIKTKPAKVRYLAVASGLTGYSGWLPMEFRKLEQWFDDPKVAYAWKPYGWKETHKPKIVVYKYRIQR